VAPTDGAPELSKTPLVLPGGLLGIELLGNLTEVTVTAEMAGPIKMFLAHALEGKGVAASLPIKAKLDNLLLGPSCYIGSDSEPISLNLTTGTTNPPPPNTPITGDPGITHLNFYGHLEQSHVSLVDNAFSSPGANGCGGPVIELVVDPSVDLKAGLPSPAGENTAIMNGEVQFIPSRELIAQRNLPDIGVCKKVTGVVVEKVKHFAGGYNNANCTEEALFHTGEYEWTGGPGAHKGFATTSGGTVLQTTGGKFVKCTASHGSGEYTGEKTATLSTVTFTGCTNPLTKAACSSSGAGSGEVVASSVPATLGFISDDFSHEEPVIAVGWDLAPSVAATCGSESVTVNGSVIGKVETINKMTPAYVTNFTQTGGKQKPESFEEEPNDTLTASFGGGAGEQAGLTQKLKVANAEKEKIEVRAENEE
jgi:hypothetical protein